VEKWNLPTRSEIAEIGKKTEGILGLKEGFYYCAFSMLDKIWGRTNILTSLILVALHSGAPDL
jgi:hypothetical protein